MPVPKDMKLVGSLPPFDGRLSGELSWALMKMRDVIQADDDLTQEDAERLYELLLSTTVGFNEIVRKKLLESPIFNENPGPLH